MAHFVGLDVSVKETSVCVVDDAGKVLCERKVPSESDDIAILLTSVCGDYVRVGIEAGPLSQWLVNGLTEAGLPVVCVETRHMKALLTAQQINKSDRNDARGIAQMMRVGLVKPVHLKTLAAQEQRMLLTSRKLIQCKLMDIECDMRGTLCNFGLKVGVINTAGYEARIRHLVEGFSTLAAIADRPARDAPTAGNAPQDAARHRSPRSGVPAVHDRTRRRPSGSTYLPCLGRSATPLCSFQNGGSPRRSDAEALSVGRDRLRRRCLQMRR